MVYYDSISFSVQRLFSRELRIASFVVFHTLSFQCSYIINQSHWKRNCKYPKIFKLSGVNFFLDTLPKAFHLPTLIKTDFSLVQMHKGSPGTLYHCSLNSFTSNLCLDSPTFLRGLCICHKSPGHIALTNNTRMSMAYTAHVCHGPPLYHVTIIPGPRLTEQLLPKPPESSQQKEEMWSVGSWFVHICSLLPTCLWPKWLTQPYLRPGACGAGGRENYIRASRRGEWRATRPHCRVWCQ